MGLHKIRESEGVNAELPREQSATQCPERGVGSGLGSGSRGRTCVRQGHGSDAKPGRLVVTQLRRAIESAACKSSCSNADAMRSS